jgi:hypothetical protein
VDSTSFSASSTISTSSLDLMFHFLLDPMLDTMLDPSIALIVHVVRLDIFRGFSEALRDLPNPSAPSSSTAKEIVENESYLFFLRLDDPKRMLPGRGRNCFCRRHAFVGFCPGRRRS